MAEVFRAKTFGVEGFERQLAVKRILPSIAEDEEFITMFIDEAKIAVQLTHANIAQIFDLGKVGDAYFIALEYIEGKDLRAIFDRMRKKGQTVPVPMAVYVIMKVCEGLDYAHNKKDAAGNDLNLVHRDVSPQNVLVSFDGQVKVIDFGIAKAAGKAGKTQAGILKGKFGYMSPEQVRGMALDRRSDIFAVGICLWEMLTGERLFVGESDFSTLEKVRNVDIVAPSSFNKRIPPDLEKIVLKALSREVEDRYQSAMDLHDDLQSWMYTSGNFFSRKDLAAFQGEVFREDIEKLAAQNEEIDEALLRSSVPPPPTPAAPRPTGTPSVPRPTGAGAPPAPPRATAVPPAPPRATGLPPVPGAVPPRPTAAGAPPRPTGSGMAPPSIPTVPAVPTMAPPSPKPTMLGMPVAPPAPPGPSLPPDLAGGRVAVPRQGAVNMEWDDDEEPTNIYGKNTAAQMAAAANRAPAAQPPRPTGPVPMPTPAPMPPSRPAPTPMPSPVLRPAPVMEMRDDSVVAARPAASSKGSRALIIGVAVGVIVAVILVVVGYKAFFEKTGAIELNITPGDELSVVVDGTRKIPQNVSPMVIDDLSAGDHSFIIRRDGYEDKELLIVVKAGQSMATNVELKASAAGQSGFYLETDPPGCTVEVDGRIIDDKSPLTVSDLQPGNHAVKLSKEKYRDMRFEVEIKKGEKQNLPLKKLELAKVEVTFNTTPQGSPVTLVEDGRRIDLGTTPASYEVYTEKTYRVEYECGREKVVKDVQKSDIASGGDRVNLAAVECDSGAGSGSGGRRPTVATGSGTRPSAGTPSAGTQPAAVPTPAASGEGYLSVQTKPWSMVYINGTFIRNTPVVKTPLKPGTYNIMVENPGFGIKRQFSVKIQAGQTTTLVEKLI